jgi:hypothetical protein
MALVLNEALAGADSRCLGLRLYFPRFSRVGQKNAAGAILWLGAHFFLGQRSVKAIQKRVCHRKWILVARVGVCQRNFFRFRYHRSTEPPGAIWTTVCMFTRRETLKLETGIDTRQLYRTSRMVSDAFGLSISPNKAVVGSNAFAHSSGIHVDGFLKEPRTYEIMRPEDVGFPKSRIVLTARTGRRGLKYRLEKLGFELSPERLEQVYVRFITVADRKKEVFDDDLIAIMGEKVDGTHECSQW